MWQRCDAPQGRATGTRVPALRHRGRTEAREPPNSAVYYWHSSCRREDSLPIDTDGIENPEGRVMIESLLYGVTPRDPTALAGAALVLLASAMVGSAVPAIRAGRVAPSEALRQD